MPLYIEHDISNACALPDRSSIDASRHRKMTAFLRDLIKNLPRIPSAQERKANKPQSPWTICKNLTLLQAFCFFVGFSAWTVDAFDFFAVTLTITRLSEQFCDGSVSSLSTSVTLTLLFRAVGALAFGIVTDRFGRRWPLTLNILCIGILSLATSFVTTYSQFLAVRSLFGIFMGGVYGMSTATALENLPAEARGFFSGILQQGYAIGSLLAACVNLSLVDHTNNWRSIFYLGAGLSFFVAILRAICPESKVFLKAKAEADSHPDPLGRSPGTIYCQTLKTAIKLHWGRFLFCVWLMAGFNFLAHGYQDLCPTYVQVTKGMSRHQSSVLTIIGNCGAVVGGVLFGWISQIIGRRLAIIIAIIWTAAFIPLWILPSSFIGLTLGASLIQFGVQGAWGVVPVYLSEVSPPAFRAIFTGLTYQIGNMISAPAVQIEARAGELHRKVLRGHDVEDYTQVQAVMMGVVCVYITTMICLAKEYRGRDFEEVAVCAAANDQTPEDASQKDKKSYESEKTVSETTSNKD
ncbi:hypothetical protein O181_001624 [Austropuccinia psidii MF-1]|uniref:Major facilitator superfamily (MFS) profile domain-containing protein n=1 Tax=Austropuccinia psidii MF-1 TaxID=1389203 RepID=A0A9Q3BAW0_9BASI|nr:hypothetical protein [Austropuccinia psidii MF-1]